MASTPSAALTGLHDIFYHILPHLTPDPRASNGILSDESLDSWSARNALSCLARSNSIFTRPALAAMWRSLPNPEALEHLLCVVRIAQRPPKGDGNMYMPALELCGTLATHGSGWLRFQEYASLVREIIINPSRRSGTNYHAPPVEDTFWSRLSSAFGDIPILPRLDVAMIRSMNSRPMDTGVLRLLNPSIREFYVIFPWASKVQLKRFQGAIKDCVLSMQNLEVFQVSISLQRSDLYQFLDIESLSSLYPRLRTLKIVYFYGAAIELDRLPHLAALPHLENLTVQVSLYYWEPADWSVTFQALRKLTLSCDQFLDIGTFLAHIDVPQLRTLSICENCANANTMAQDLAVHLHTLVTRCPALTSFYWTSIQVNMAKMGYVGKPRIDVPLAELVAPLLDLRTMQHFSACFRGPAVSYTPADLRAFAEAWPGLETFHFYDSDSSESSDEEHYADVESIAAFARACPQLHSLHIPIARLDLPATESVCELAAPVATSPPLYSLRELYVHDVDISRPRETGSGERRDYKEDARHFRAVMQLVLPCSVVHIDTESRVVFTFPTKVSDNSSESDEEYYN